MPIYVYECQQCGGRFEYQQSLAEPPKSVCEVCAGKLEKIIVPIAFHLKGGGWYKDLYSKPSGEKKSESAGETKSETKSETKTESSTKSETKPAGGEK